MLCTRIVEYVVTSGVVKPRVTLVVHFMSLGLKF